MGVENPIEILIKSQQAAIKVATDTVKAVAGAAVTGVTQPTELVGQVADLAGSVAGLAGVLQNLLGATAQPLQDVLVRQRELADTVAVLADAQADIAAVVSKLAERHAAAVAALEKLSSPIFMVAGTSPTAPWGREKKGDKDA
ncbi:hypothetical protein Back2_07370 [Nocardioides baekrokdamisoli]|uniref:Uncharacterized protein n=1 Tax=Nocardioides baekrokdamisoli TaxID=1804624 RepID=A0A3G9IC19_9ACTN|nr:hypothetical protein [Nocardioides baekrokdamisoli]BBH16450.1 hypothetical protein Back2_07370 [Nocardioides baekrokdamisoli]